MKTKIIGLICILIAISIFIGIAYFNSTKREIPVVFSGNAMLNNLWSHYKTDFLEAGTLRTLDKQQNNITTSEGESYTMLRAAWEDDKDTFDKSWKWTKDNLGRKDSLFAWKFGKRANGTYGQLTDQGGQNTASDADTDIALANIFAYSRWQQKDYLDNAKKIIGDIWNNEVVIINKEPVLASNNLEKISKTGYIIVNPSYFSPYAYRIFAKIDHEHEWSKLIDNSYRIIQESSILPLNKSKSIGLPPDWITINKSNGEIQTTTLNSDQTDFSYDAMRVIWRIYLDWKWNSEPRAKAQLEKFGFLNDEWQKRKLIYATYSHDGTIVSQNESPASYGAYIGYFLATNQTSANDIYENKLKYLYDPDKENWKKELNYYDTNWAWFGLGIYENALNDLSKDVKF